MIKYEVKELGATELRREGVSKAVTTRGGQIEFFWSSVQKNLKKPKKIGTRAKIIVVKR